MTERAYPGAQGCICEFPSHCGFSGTLVCFTCGGDQCVCTCGSETDCDGCPECPVGEDGFDVDDEACACPDCRLEGERP